MVLELLIAIAKEETTTELFSTTYTVRCMRESSGLIDRWVFPPIVTNAWLFLCHANRPEEPVLEALTKSRSPSLSMSAHLIYGTSSALNSHTICLGPKVPSPSIFSNMTISPFAEAVLKSMSPSPSKSAATIVADLSEVPTKCSDPNVPFPSKFRKYPTLPINSENTKSKSPSPSISTAWGFAREVRRVREPVVSPTICVVQFVPFLFMFSCQAR